MSNPHLGPRVDQGGNQVRADEAGAAGDTNGSLKEGRGGHSGQDRQKDREPRFPAALESLATRMIIPCWTMTRPRGRHRPERRPNRPSHDSIFAQRQNGAKPILMLQVRDRSSQREHDQERAAVQLGTDTTRTPRAAARSLRSLSNAFTNPRNSLCRDDPIRMLDWEVYNLCFWPNRRERR